MGEKILIIEDNITNLKLVRLLLKIEGYEILTASDASEALHILQTVHPKLILMDLQLPGKNGLDLTKEIKADPKLKDIVIIALTAYAMKGDEEKAKLAGCDEYMTKPISVDNFPAVIAEYMVKYAKPKY